MLAEFLKCCETQLTRSYVPGMVQNLGPSAHLASNCDGLRPRPVTRNSSDCGANLQNHPTRTTVDEEIENIRKSTEKHE